MPQFRLSITQLGEPERTKIFRSETVETALEHARRQVEGKILIEDVLPTSSPRRHYLALNLVGGGYLTLEHYDGP